MADLRYGGRYPLLLRFLTLFFKIQRRDFVRFLAFFAYVTMAEHTSSLVTRGWTINDLLSIEKQCKISYSNV